MFMDLKGLKFSLLPIWVLVLCLSACASKKEVTDPLAVKSEHRATTVFQLLDGSKVTESYTVRMPAYDEFLGLERSIAIDVRFDAQGMLVPKSGLSNPDSELLQEFLRVAQQARYSELAGKEAIARVAFKQFADPYTSAILGRAQQLEDEEESEQAMQILEQVKAKDADTVAVLVLRAELLSNFGKFDQSVVHYSKAIELSPENERIYYARAYRWKRLKQYDKALADLLRTLAIEPKHWETYDLLASTSKEKGNVLDAIKYTTMGLKYRQDHHFYNQRGWVYLDNENLELALLDFRKADELSPNSGSITSGLARTYYELGQYESALVAVSRALKIDGNNTYDLHLKGLVLEELEQYAEAKKCYELVINTLEPTGQTYNNLGWLHILSGSYAEAIRTYQIQVEKGLGSHRQRNNLATAYYLGGHLDQALSTFEQAINEDDDDDSSFSYAWKAKIHVQKGELELAYSSLKYVMEKDPQYYDGLNEKKHKGANSLPAILDEFAALARARKDDDKIKIASKWREAL